VTAPRPAWLRWAERLQAIAQTGLTYAKDPYDLERYGERVLSFELSSPPVSSNEIRERLARGKTVEGLVPPAVAAALDETGLYRGYTEREPERT